MLVSQQVLSFLHGKAGGENGSGGVHGPPAVVEVAGGAEPLHGLEDLQDTAEETGAHHCQRATSYWRWWWW